MAQEVSSERHVLLSYNIPQKIETPETLQTKSKQVTAGIYMERRGMLYVYRAGGKREAETTDGTHDQEKTQLTLQNSVANSHRRDHNMAVR